MNDFQHGPFDTASTGRAGMDFQQWTLSYNGEMLQQKTMPANATRAQIIDALDIGRAEFIRRHLPAATPATNPVAHGYIVRLVESTEITGEKGREIDQFLCLAPIDGLTGSLIDNRWATWIVADELHAATPMDAEQFYRLKAAHDAIYDALVENQPKPARPPKLAWVADLLPDAVMTDNPADWQAPTSWQLRHIVGEGSFSGISGAKAAELVGVTPQNFRKYLAADSASTRQKMSFAMWHLLLQKIGMTTNG